MIAILITWIAFCVLVGYLAKEKGRDPAMWGIISAVLSPIIGFVALMVAGDKEPGR